MAPSSLSRACRFGPGRAPSDRGVCSAHGRRRHRLDSHRYQVHQVRHDVLPRSGHARPRRRAGRHRPHRDRPSCHGRFSGRDATVRRHRAHSSAAVRLQRLVDQPGCPALGEHRPACAVHRGSASAGGPRREPCPARRPARHGARGLRPVGRCAGRAPVARRCRRSAPGHVRVPAGAPSPHHGRRVAAPRLGARHRWRRGHRRVRARARRSDRARRRGQARQVGDDRPGTGERLGLELGDHARRAVDPRHDEPHGTPRWCGVPRAQARRSASAARRPVEPRRRTRRDVDERQRAPARRDRPSLDGPGAGAQHRGGVSPCLRGVGTRRRRVQPAVSRRLRNPARRPVVTSARTACGRAACGQSAPPIAARCMAERVPPRVPAGARGGSNDDAAGHRVGAGARRPSRVVGERVCARRTIWCVDGGPRSIARPERISTCRSRRCRPRRPGRGPRCRRVRSPR